MMAMKKERMPLLIPALAAGVKVILWFVLEETEGWGGGSAVVGKEVRDVKEGDDEVEDNNEEEDDDDDDDAAEADNGDTEADVARSVEEMSDNDANEVKNDDVDDAVEAVDVDTEVVMARSVDGMLGSSCILLGSGSPPASPKAAIPHVFGPTMSLDVIEKLCVLAPSSPEKFSTCMWQTPSSL